MYVIPEELEISGFCNLSLHWYKCSAMHFNNHFILLGSQPKVSKTLRQGREGFSAPDLPHWSYEQLLFLPQAGGARAHTDCASTWRYCKPQVQEQPPRGWHQPTGTKGTLPQDWLCTWALAPSLQWLKGYGGLRADCKRQISLHSS